MFKRRSQDHQAGYTIVEVLIVVAVLAIISQAFAVFMRSASKVTIASREKAVAFEHAIQMLEELRSVVTDDNAAIEELDKYNDGRAANGDPIYKFTLTTKREVTNPAGNTLPDYQTGIARLSGNALNQGGYNYVRHVEVSNDPVDSKLRRIRVRIWRSTQNGGPTASTLTAKAGSKLPLAEVFGTVRSLATGNKPTQVLDVYLIALENVPGWWSRTSNLIPLMRSSLISLQSRNPGLQLRPHWIRRMSYGRDVEYTPEINESVLASASGALKKAYVYPGYITYSDGDDYYYLPSWFKARINKDGVLKSDNSDLVDGYPMADQFNHAMRLPDEDRLFAIHQLVNANAGAEAPEMSLRMLLDKMNDPTNKEMINSVVINLHGEMLPVLPLRNYSDAAKDPAYFWDSRSPKRAWRAVSHAEKLSYPAGSDVSFRTYVYDMNAGGIADPISTANETDAVNYVTLFVPGANFSNLKTLERMQGSSNTTYAWKRSASFTGGGATAWKYVSTAAAVADATNTYTARWWADEYTPPGRSTGLRIVFQGATPTAREFANKPYQP